ncbi:hypothetical protein EZS27_042473, partial [termite gut metagenome]
MFLSKRFLLGVSFAKRIFGKHACNPNLFLILRNHSSIIVMRTQTIKKVLCSTLLCTASIVLFGQDGSGPLPRVASSKAITKAVNDCKEAARQAELDVHSLMVLHHGKVIAEFWQGEGAPDKPHVMHSVSKTF